MRMIERVVAPMDLRMAMSRFFSMTTMMSALMMFRAATRMIRSRAMKMPSFSSLRAANRFRLSCIQSRTEYCGPSASRMAAAVRSARSTSATRTSSPCAPRSRSASERAVSRLRKPMVESYSYMPVSKMPTTRQVRMRGRMPPGESGPLGEMSRTRSFGPTCSCRAMSRPRTMPGTSPGRSRSVSAPNTIFSPMLITRAAVAGSMPRSTTPVELAAEVIRAWP